MNDNDSDLWIAVALVMGLVVGSYFTELGVAGLCEDNGWFSMLYSGDVYKCTKVLGEG